MRGTIDLLLEHGAPLNVTDRVGRTPLDVARIQGYRRLEESLRNRRAEPVGVLIATYDWMYDYRLPDRDEFKRLADFRDMWARTAQP